MHEKLKMRKMIILDIMSLDLNCKLIKTYLISSFDPIFEVEI